VSGIGVVLNPRSGRNLRDPRAALRLARTLGDHGVLRQARSIDELYRIAEDFRRDDIDVLAISGGDGTNHVTLTGFLDVYGGATMPQVALLRGGTMNTVANSVGVRRGGPEGLLGRLVRDYARRGALDLENVERHVMRIAPRSSGKAQYGFLFGTGVVHGFLAEYYRHGDPSPLVALETLARGVGSAIVRGETIRRMARPFRGSVTFDGASPAPAGARSTPDDLASPAIAGARSTPDDLASPAPAGARSTPDHLTNWEEQDFLAVAAGTISHIGLHFKPFCRFDERPGQFHILGIYASPLSFVFELPRIHRGEPMRAGRALEAVSSQAVVRSWNGKVEYMIDGDLHETRGELEVAVGPRVRLVVVR
jgi:diacylglycerol kinase family enzyme